ncbi:MAG: Smr/MutS family protein [Gammaproteobacteria bacterium]|nr:Smr/MutS family protein [Gammaproteobacteria bacterium]
MKRKNVSSFEDQMHGVQPLKSGPPRVAYRPETKFNRSKHRANAQGLSVQPNNLEDLSDLNVKLLLPDDFVEWKLDGVQPKVFSAFQEGKYPIQRSLDLHKVDIRRARSLVAALVDQSIDQDHRCVRILHGRGRKGNPPAQLKSHVVHWLAQHRDVIAYTTAPRHLGGTGAVLVKIRKGHKAKQDNRERFGG